MTKGCQLIIERVANGWIVREHKRFDPAGEYALPSVGQELVFQTLRALHKFIGEHYA